MYLFKVLCYKSEGRWFDLNWCQWIFHWHKILPIALWPGVDSDSNRNGYQEFPGGKGGRCVRLTTLPPSCAVVTRSGNLNFWNPLGHSRPITGLLYFYIGNHSELDTCSYNISFFKITHTVTSRIINLSSWIVLCNLEHSDVYMSL